MSPKHIAKLRQILPSIIAENFKSYEVPGLCERLGMDGGTDGEAFNSKRMYVHKRLSKLSAEQIIVAATQLATDVDDDDLQSLLKEQTTPSHASISDTLKRFDSNLVHARWELALSRRTSDPAGAITLARTLLEDVCKWLLAQAKVSHSDKDDLPQLYRKVGTVLNLAPDAHTEHVFKRILGSCQSVVESLGSLRNKLGDAHSAGPLKARPAARHAELAVNLSGTMASFLVATWEAKSSRE